MLSPCASIKEPLKTEREKCRKVNNVNMDLVETGSDGADWIVLVWDTDK
jgi:hypothetical protein